MVRSQNLDVIQEFDTCKFQLRRYSHPRFLSRLETFRVPGLDFT